MRPSTLWTTVLLAICPQTHALALNARDATSANIPPTGIDINELAKDPERLHDAFTTTSTTTLSRSRRWGGDGDSSSSWKKGKGGSGSGTAAAAYADTANELTDGTPCREVTLIYARGTTQDGNIGAAGDVGPVFMDELAGIIGADALAVQGVDYPADVVGFLAGGSPSGSRTMANLVALVSCHSFFYFSFFHLGFLL